MSAETIHRLWTTLWAALAALAALGALLTSRLDRARRKRLNGLFVGHPRTAVRSWTWRPSFPGSRGELPRGPLRDGAAALGAGSLGFILVGGIAGMLVGLAVAFGIWRWLQQHMASGEQEAKAAEERAAAAQLPLTADLLAACLAAGSGPRDAALAVGDSLGGPLGERLQRAAAELRLGGEPAAAWARLAELPGATGLARCLERSHASGAPAMEPVSRLAAECRAGRARTATERARRAGVLVTGPLGVCFLPAFLLAGVVPVVIGLGKSLI